MGEMGVGGQGPEFGAIPTEVKLVPVADKQREYVLVSTERTKSMFQNRFDAAKV